MCFELASKKYSITMNTAKHSTLPWAEKYRPNLPDEMFVRNEVTKTVLRLVDAGRLPHLLFYGPPGTGKTTTIKAIAHQCYKGQSQHMVLELNASDERGIDVVRHEIQSFASSQRFHSTGCKLVILDECDNMTKDAQFALRRIIEKNTRQTRFCLVANYASKIIVALQSRCMKFRFAPFATAHVKERVAHMASSEKLSIDDAGISAIVDISNGDMRRACNLLQSCALSTNDTIKEQSVYSIAGRLQPTDVNMLLHCLLTSDLTNSIRCMGDMLEQHGVSFGTILSSLLKKLFESHMEPTQRSKLVAELADAELAASHATREKLQIRALASSFVSARG